MSPELIDRVQQEASKAVRNLPKAHGAWQFWRNAAFRSHVEGVVEAIYTMDVSALSDAHFQALEEALRVVLAIIDVHVSKLGSDVRDAVDREHFKDMTAKL